MGSNSLLAKIDIKAAYRLVPVCPTEHVAGYVLSIYMYVDAMLPLGLHQHQNFNTLADALEWCITKASVQVLYHI